MGDVWKWGREVGGNSWRTAGDLGGDFEGIPAALFRDVFGLYGRNELQKYSGPGAWNDPDYLLIGLPFELEGRQPRRRRLRPTSNTRTCRCGVCWRPR